MQLDDFKPTWRRIRFLNAMQPIEQEEILCIIEKAEYTTRTKLHRVLTSATLFVLITICCQAG